MIGDRTGDTVIEPALEKPTIKLKRLSEEEILRYWDFSVDQPKHLFLSAGKAVAQAQLDLIKSELEALGYPVEVVG